mmetsp:Transcript_6221/g.21318  ORF Transcript_6221/g.21318 Transcript_6221/m.21318 type:complete len:394 (+) Transcript_6221:2989-4170(+)
MGACHRAPHPGRAGPHQAGPAAPHRGQGRRRGCGLHLGGRTSPPRPRGRRRGPGCALAAAQGRRLQGRGGDLRRWGGQDLRRGQRGVPSLPRARVAQREAAPPPASGRGARGWGPVGVRGHLPREVRGGREPQPHRQPAQPAPPGLEVRPCLPAPLGAAACVRRHGQACGGGGPGWVQRDGDGVRADRHGEDAHDQQPRGLPRGRGGAGGGPRRDGAGCGAPPHGAQGGGTQDLCAVPPGVHGGRARPPQSQGKGGGCGGAAPDGRHCIQGRGLERDRHPGRLCGRAAAGGGQPRGGRTEAQLGLLALALGAVRDRGPYHVRRGARADGRSKAHIEAPDCGFGGERTAQEEWERGAAGGGGKKHQPQPHKPGALCGGPCAELLPHPVQEHQAD